ncbi:Transporter, MFS superfamily [Giardia duodenalis]|uniref:Transporter, MFS superfamily n=1 Tax=Giardia intestinalis TaxID=5741 RepID=V6TN40_GIAIN|nr:Transporter, MFS superfamily [Giardia intestinalis]
MANLVLNPAGETRARTQYRCFEYLRLLVAAAGHAFDAYGLGDSNRDRYLGDCIQCTDILELVVCAAGCAAAGPPSAPLDADSPKMDLHLPEAMGASEAVLPAADPAEAHRRYQNYCTEMNRVHPDPLHPAPELATTETYFKLVDHLFSSLVYVEKLMGTPKIDWNADNFTLDYKPCPDEVKLVINLDAEAISAMDNNKDLQDKRTWCSCRVIHLLAINIVAGLGYQCVGLTLPFYLTDLSATPSQTLNSTAFFNLAQLICCPLFLWASEFIGRRIIMSISFAGYTVMMAVYSLALLIGEANTAAGNQSKINFILGMRAINGIFAITIPISFLIASDIANPRVRPMVLIGANVCNQLGSAAASLLVSFVFSTGRYDTKTNPSAVSISFQHTCYVASASYALCLILSVCMKESSAGVLARKAAKKMGKTNTTAYRENLKRDSFCTTFKVLVKSRELVILWFAYLFQMFSSQLPFSSSTYIVSKFYGFSDSQVAKKWSSIAAFVSVLIALAFVLGLTRILAKYMGELRVIIMSIILSMIPGLLRWAVDPPIPIWLLFLPFNTIALNLGDALIVQFATLYTTPQNRGTLMGLFQIGNSIGRFGAALMAGELYNWNWRNGSLLFMLYGSVSLIFLCFVRPILEQNVANQLEQKQKEERASLARV